MCPCPCVGWALHPSYFGFRCPWLYVGSSHFHRTSHWVSFWLHLDSSQHAGQLWSWLSFRKIDDSPRVCLTGEKHWGKTKEKRGKFPGKKRSNFNIRCWDLGHSHVVILIDTAEPGGDSIYETCSAGDIEMKCARTQLSDSIRIGDIPGVGVEDPPNIPLMPIHS